MVKECSNKTAYCQEPEATLHVIDDWRARTIAKNDMALIFVVMKSEKHCLAQVILKAAAPKKWKITMDNIENTDPTDTTHKPLRYSKTTGGLIINCLSAHSRWGWGCRSSEFEFDVNHLKHQPDTRLATVEEKVHEIRVREWIVVVVRGKEARYINGTTAPVLLGHRSPQANDIKLISPKSASQLTEHRVLKVGAQSTSKSIPSAIRVNSGVDADLRVGIAMREMVREGKWVEK
ncbi:hypothetical protein K438DRAFT_1761675 [Mycena galopus ATCC 62051]|nr:hypothetical protein K438DRAFT_1761675 [Mycena galopus ATCC 62051]